jgi:hypothetical protein
MGGKDLSGEEEFSTTWQGWKKQGQDAKVLKVER